MRINVQRLTDTAILPTYAYEEDAGADLYSDETITIMSQSSYCISTGIAIAIPEGYFGLNRIRSGLARDKQIVLCSSGIIDAGYRGPLKVNLLNLGRNSVIINRGDRIAQLVIIPFIQANFYEVDLLPKTDRGRGSFG